MMRGAGNRGKSVRSRQRVFVPRSGGTPVTGHERQQRLLVTGVDALVQVAEFFGQINNLLADSGQRLRSALPNKQHGPGRQRPRPQGGPLDAHIERTIQPPGTFVDQAPVDPEPPGRGRQLKGNRGIGGHRGRQRDPNVVLLHVKPTGWFTDHGITAVRVLDRHGLGVPT